jgi:uncharacterized Zn-binding protein involved in type VI secretion
MTRLQRRTELAAFSAAAIALFALLGCGGSLSKPQPPPVKPAINPAQGQVADHGYPVVLSGTRGPHGQAIAPTARATITIKRGSDQLCWNITDANGLADPIHAYIRRGNSRSTGPIVVPLGNGYRPAGCEQGTAPALLVRIEARADQYYLEISTRSQPLGAARGQL